MTIHCILPGPPLSAVIIQRGKLEETNTPEASMDGVNPADDDDKSSRDVLCGRGRGRFGGRSGRGREAGRGRLATGRVRGRGLGQQNHHPHHEQAVSGRNRFKFIPDKDNNGKVVD